MCLFCQNPGLGLDKLRATPSIFIGMQLILPGEFAPTHKHSPSAIRMVIEGNGGWTIVQGEKCPMEKGDLILTPSGLWHEHGHDGKDPVIWMDALDLPAVAGLEASYAIDGNIQNSSPEKDSSQTRYLRAGLVPFSSLSQRKSRYPMVRFPWKDVKESLHALATITPKNQAVQLAYVNPETGEECMPVLGFSALMLRPGETLKPNRRSSSAVYHVIEGAGEANIDGKHVTFADNDVVAIPDACGNRSVQQVDVEGLLHLPGRRCAHAAQARILRRVRGLIAGRPDLQRRRQTGAAPSSFDTAASRPTQDEG